MNDFNLYVLFWATYTVYARDGYSVIDLERKLMEYSTLNGFDKCIHSIERFATSVPLIEKAR
jgi:hypothetical protein